MKLTSRFFNIPFWCECNNLIYEHRITKVRNNGTETRSFIRESTK